MSDKRVIKRQEVVDALKVLGIDPESTMSVRIEPHAVSWEHYGDSPPEDAHRLSMEVDSDGFLKSTMMREIER